LKDSKLYVLVCKNLSNSQRAVQAGHVVAEFLLNGPKTSWSNGILVYLGVENEFELEKWIFKLNCKEIKWIGFKEPDIGNQLTAIASEGNDKVFKKLKLL